MRTSAKVITALSVAGLIGIAGSAFTATSDIDADEKFVGATSQIISGVNVSSVQYTTDTSTDITTVVNFHVDETLDPAFTTIDATIGNGSTTQSDECGQALVGVDGVDGTDLTCTFTGLANVITLSIVAS